jgi:hypothetical protein
VHEPDTQFQTLRGLIEGRYSLTAYCANAFVCSRSAKLRLDMLVQRLGWEFNIYEGRALLRWRLICSHCGTREPSLILAPHSEPIAQAGSHIPMGAMSVAEATQRAVAFNREATARDKALGIPPHPGGRHRRFGG